jgi:hypothetical protein
VPILDIRRYSSAAKVPPRDTSASVGAVIPANVSKRYVLRAGASRRNTSAATMALPPRHTPHSTKSPAMPRSHAWRQASKVANKRSALVMESSLRVT